MCVCVYQVSNVTSYIPTTTTTIIVIIIIITTTILCMFVGVGFNCFQHDAFNFMMPAGKRSLVEVEHETMCTRVVSVASYCVCMILTYRVIANPCYENDGNYFVNYTDLRPLQRCANAIHTIIILRLYHSFFPKIVIWETHFSFTIPHFVFYQHFYHCAIVQKTRRAGGY